MLENTLRSKSSALILQMRDSSPRKKRGDETKICGQDFWDSGLVTSAH